MKRFIPVTLLLWAFRDLCRYPARTLLNVTALMVLTFFAATALLASQALNDSTRRLLAKSPALVIRRLNAGGWMPIPIKKALVSIQKVPGIINPRPRIWGLVATPQGPLTILAMDDDIKSYLKEKNIALPNRGQAVIGNGLAQTYLDKSQNITLSSKRSLQLKIIAVLPAATDMVSFDLIITTTQDARYILNIPEAMASDFALDVFHQNEAKALVPELANAFPWSVSITSREETQKHFSANIAQKGSVAMILLVPAIIALILLILATGYDVLARRTEAGLLRALGWTTHDLAGMQILRSSLICLPSVVIGQSAAYCVIFTPVIKWVNPFFLGWSQSTPTYYLSSIGAGLILIELFALIAVPYILTSLWPVLVLSAKDPLSLLKGDFNR
ncbi:MAG: ABC transporter permease [Desulfobacteraceae bacterium]|jgi:ABC-type lipoprotein release transport system permease subunit